MSNKISLSQFLNFSVKVHTGAKINAVRHMKNDEYSIGQDYYFPLRTAIRRYTQGKDTLDSILDAAQNSKEDRRANFIKDATKFVNFMKKHDVQFFEVGNASWSYDNRIIISASSEFGMICNGKRYFVKNFYRKQNPKDKITLTKMRPTLTLMRTATSQTDLAGANAAVLNLQNGKLLFDDKPINANKLLELQADAAQLAAIWEMV